MLNATDYQLTTNYPTESYLLDNFQAADSSDQECSRSVGQQQQMEADCHPVQLLSR